MKTTRTLTLAGALALGLALAPSPTPASAARGFTTPKPALTITLDDATESDGEVTGAVHLSSPLTADLAATVQVLFPDSGPEDLGCPTLGPGCPWTIDLDLPAGATSAAFEVSVVEGDGPEATEVVGAAISHTWPADRVTVGAGAEAYLFDGDGLDLSIADEAEVDEGDPGDDRTLDVVVTADQAVPEDVGVHVHTAIVGESAVPPADYAAVDVIAVIPAGATSTTVEVPVVGDQLAEADELLLVFAGDPSLGEVAFDGTTLVGRILDDDGFTRPGGPGGYQSPSRSARSAERTA